MTFSFKYLLAGAPCEAALVGIVGAGVSATPFVALEGVDVRGAADCDCGAGEGYTKLAIGQSKSDSRSGILYRSFSHYGIGLLAWRLDL